MRRGSRSKPDRDALVARLLRKGVLYREIAKRFGISETRVGQIGRREGVPQRYASPVPVTQDERVTVVRLAKNGLHVSGIRDVVGRGYRTIMAILTQAGVVPHNGQDIFGTDARSKAIKLVMGGMSYGEAAEEVGMTRNAVAGACNRAGVKVPEREKAERHARGCERGRVTRRETWRAKAELEDA